jgi:spermidine synthase
MIPRVLIDTAAIPGGGELRLIQRGTEFSIMLGGNELMNSRLSGSEEALATMACARIAARPAAHMLIGGLGMGFTLRAALAGLGAGARITVAELVPAVVAWARGPMAHITGDSLDDPRVETIVADVVPLIRAAQERYDAILLDVDNGPDAITQDGNDRLYDKKGLRAAWAALRPGGVLAVWSAAADDAFSARLGRAGFVVDEVKVRATRSGRGAHHMLWFATRSE